MTDKLKQFIFNNLIKDLSNVEIIRHDESLWFIDREKKYWYLELVKTGKLYWRYQFFTEFFNMYSIDRDVYEPIIKEFVELVLNNSITSTQVDYGVFKHEKVDDALNNGVTSMSRYGHPLGLTVNLILNNGVTSTHEIAGLSDDIVNSVLTNGVTTKLRGGNATNQIKSILNNGVKDSMPLDAYRENMISYVLKDNPIDE